MKRAAEFGEVAMCKKRLRSTGLDEHQDIYVKKDFAISYLRNWTNDMLTTTRQSRWSWTQMRIVGQLNWSRFVEL